MGTSTYIMIKMLFVLATLVAFTYADHSDHRDYRVAFNEARARYGEFDGLPGPRSEPPLVAKLRYQAFVRYASLVDEINGNKNIPFTAEDNFMSILLEEEKKAYLGLNVTGHELSPDYVQERLVLRSDHPESRDFSDKISGIKNQGRCGSCWTFAATAALEGEMYFKNSKQGINLSEQEYMECSTSRDGCNGGWMADCYTYTRNNDRIAPTSAAPYTARDSRQCNYGNTENAMIQTGVRLTGNYNFRGDDQLLHMAASHIVSVAIKVSNKFQVYKSGVMVDNTCNTQPDHAVAVVGYGAEGSQKFWRVRNSWGTGWGDRGYIKMDRNKENMCMISTYSHIPIIECRDPNNCNPANPDDDSDDHDDNDDEDDRSPKLCWKKVGLGRCLENEESANSVCEEVGQDKCAVLRLKKCWYGASEESNARARAHMWLNLPCGKDDEEGTEPSGECDAAAGLVFCSDCNCCKHEHMCNDRA